MIRTQASNEEVVDVFSGRPLYCGHAGSSMSAVSKHIKCKVDSKEEIG